MLAGSRGEKTSVVLLLCPNASLHGKLNEATLRFACTLYSIIVFAILIRFLIAN